ncbi:FAD/NAD(P)-binding protein [Corynebacterium lubricantis]|uniref:FAD/NAD(P)-binding protein n=1 Tax=Corynebacterium lubricantis TaxID=541095 RepID=UPI0003685AC0|nr:FAD/NAD(P)-binding protein [Corynebacterium lubricantis]
MPLTAPSIAIIGLGPRGVSTLERLIARLNTVDNPPERLVLHLIDDAQHGGGKVWDINQTKALCMNTFAHGMTLFAEPGATVEAPVIEGPTIYEWVRLHLGDTSEVSPEKLAFVEKHPLQPEVNERFSDEELGAIRPESYPHRALYGYYLLWFFHSILKDVPEWVTVVQHKARATNIHAVDDHDVITLDNGEDVTASATIAVTGWQNQGMGEQEKWIKHTLETHPNLNWIRADNPIEQDIDSIKDNENVLARGLGMGFFDVLIMTTTERGGQFVDDENASGGVRYIPTGKEPTFYASSRRGYPFMPQSDDGGLPPAAEIPRLKKVVAQLSSRSGRRSIDYDVEVWPAVLRDAYHAYVKTLARVEPEALKADLDTIVAAIDDAEIDASVVFNGVTAMDDVITQYTTKRFSLLRWLHLIPATFDNTEELTAYLVQRMQEDLSDAEAGQDSPVRAALWSIGFSRKPTQVLGAEGRYTVESRHHMFDKAIALGQLACSGPPIFRTRQLLALVDAGVVRFIGAHPFLDTDRHTGEWTMSSPSSGGVRYKGTTLLDAWVNKPDYRRKPVESLSLNLVEKDRVRLFTDVAEDGTELPTGSVEQDPQTRRVINPDGVQDPRLHMVGIPAHSQYPDTTISPPIPGTDPWFIQETDKAANSAATIALSSVAVNQSV